MRRLVVLSVLASVSCGPSAAEIRRARNVSYQAPFATVWNVVVSQAKAEYRAFVVEDAVKGDIDTDWRLVQRKANEDTATAPNPQDEAAVQLYSGVFMRARIRVRGDEKMRPPYTITIEGEAAEYRPGYTVLQPLRGAEEPPWVKERLDRLHYEIYRRLEAHAIAVKAAPAAPARELDTSRWADLDPDLAALVARVHEAAKHRDVPTLRPLLDPAFVWSLRGEPGAEAAVALYAADPGMLRNLALALERGCAPRDGEPRVVTCPAGSSVEASDGPRAGFEKRAGAWQFTFFVGGP